VFFHSDGSNKSFNIKWQPITYLELSNKLQKTNQKQEFAINTIGTDSYWVQAPSFSASRGATDEIPKIGAKLKEISETAKLIVIDVRGNSGGNSGWGDYLIKSIYGANYSQRFTRRKPSNPHALWRASKDNYNYLTSSALKSIKKQFSESSSQYISFKNLTDRMQTALNNNIDLIRQTPKNQLTKHEKNITALLPPLKTKVILLTDHHCASACLDFLDSLLMLPNTTHVGHETSADTVYMDVRQINLPSGLGAFILPQKVYRNRIRKNNESYKPKHLYPGDIRNTEFIRQWILNLFNVNPEVVHTSNLNQQYKLAISATIDAIN